MTRAAAVICAATMVILTFGTSPAQADINVTSWELTTLVSNPTVETTRRTIALPFQATDEIATAENTAFNRTSYDFNVAGDRGRFQFGFDQQRKPSATTNPTMALSAGRIAFRITGTEDLAYTLDGFFTLTGNANNVTVYARVHDLTSGWSSAFGNITPTLSRTHAAWQDGPLESLTGTLAAGHDYELYYRFGLAGGSATPEESAVGGLNMNITMIPAPGAAMLGLIGLTVVGAVRRRLA